MAPCWAAVRGGRVGLGVGALGGDVVDRDLGGDVLQGGAVFDKKPAQPAQVATRAESAICWGFVRPWPPSLKGRAMRPCAMSSVSRRSSVMLEIFSPRFHVLDSGRGRVTLFQDRFKCAGIKTL